MDSLISYKYLTGEKRFDAKAACDAALECAQEGIVLLKNENDALPVPRTQKTAVFGRMQKHYLMAGTGSGGRVYAPFVTDIFSSLSSLGASLDKDVESFYDNYVKEHPYDKAGGWTHPASQNEPELDEAFVAEAAMKNETALYIITRIAGEDRDLKNERGEFLARETELNNLKLLRKHFAKLVVALNISGVMDLHEIAACDPDALLLLWTGGMMGGEAAAKVMLGDISPSGRLPDTIAAAREDYPAYDNCGKPGKIIYAEDIYAGYRYFNTFCPEKILYPFGYGLSYTNFDIEILSFERSNGSAAVKVKVTNTGDRASKEVVQCYVECPQGKLGKPKRVLAAFAKTKTLSKGESEVVELEINDALFASYDDISHKWLLEKGKYVYCLGKNVCRTSECGFFELCEDKVIKTCESALAPVTPFDRLVNDNGKMRYVPAPLRAPSAEPVPGELKAASAETVSFDDVADGKASIEDFIARLSDEELVSVVRAEGMSSPKVTPGTAAAFVGVTPSLRAKGLPALCCTDGPSGIRMVSDAKCIAYPSAVCLASTWNPALVEKTYGFCGAELATYCVDILLGPGTNIHRDPLCGRNFEYFSEDPLLSGKMAAAVCRGLDSSGVSGAVKHFMANNQETDRHGSDSVISERAVREIYARPFEICVKESPVCSVMTSYNSVNGNWAASNYDLVTRLLRDDFGFGGFVMTDWWARVDDGKGSFCTTNLASMVHAGNDIYMVTSDALNHEDDLESSLSEGTLTRGELQACALRLCAFALKSLSYRAQRSGYGSRDLRAECENKTPAAKADIEDGKAFCTLNSAVKAIVKINYISNTAELTQTNIVFKVNDKSAGSLIVGGTNGKVMSDYRECAFAAGENKLRFKPESADARVVSVEIY